MFSICVIQKSFFQKFDFGGQGFEGSSFYFWLFSAKNDVGGTKKEELEDNMTAVGLWMGGMGVNTYAWG